jgi:RNA polymerase sigma factor (sigma-70 family)
VPNCHQLDAAYAHLLKRYPSLSRDDETQLHGNSNGQAARVQLVEGNLRLAAKIALKYRGRGVELDELVAEANLALVEAAGKFDPTRGTRFGTYATHRIGWHLTNVVGRRPQEGGDPEESGVAAPDRAAESPVAACDIREELDAVTAELSDRERDVIVGYHGNGDTYKAIGKRLGLSVEGVRKAEERAMAKARAAAATRE